MISASVCLVLDMLLPLSKLRNHTQFCADLGEQVTGGWQLYLRSMDSLESKPIPGTENGLEPFFSPDGQWVSFFADGKLKKVALSGGIPLIICDAAGADGGSWGPDDTIYFAPGSFSALWQVPAKGGTPQPFTKLDSQKGEISHRWPQVLPGGKAVLFTVWTRPGWGEKQVQLQRLGDGERSVLVQAGHTGSYVPTGHLVYYQSGQGTLMAVPFRLPGPRSRGALPLWSLRGFVKAPRASNTRFLKTDHWRMFPEIGMRCMSVSSSRLTEVERQNRWNPLRVPINRQNFLQMERDLPSTLKDRRMKSGCTT